METSPPNARYERKFIADGFALPEVLALVRRHGAVFREAFPPRIVNNLYLDSPDLRDYRDHINGVARRSKTRVRWYGVGNDATASPVLERKLKYGLVSAKVSYPLPTMKAAVAGSALPELFDCADLPPLTRSSLRHQLPCLFNRYRRHYFQTADARFRVTVDSNLQFADASRNHGSQPYFGPPAPTLVLELKFGLADADAASMVTNALPFRLSRCSKYVLGLNRLAGC